MIRNPTRHQTLMAPHERSSTANSDPHTNPFPFLLFPFSHNNGGVSQQSDIFSPPHHLFYHIPSATSTSTLPHALYLAPFSPPSLAFLTLRFKSKSPSKQAICNLQTRPRSSRRTPTPAVPRAPRLPTPRGQLRTGSRDVVRWGYEGKKGRVTTNTHNRIKNRK